MTYVSSQPDPHANHIYAFTLSWNEYNLVYLFHPFTLILTSLQRLLLEKVIGVMIVCNRATQSQTAHGGS